MNYVLLLVILYEFLVVFVSFFFFFYPMFYFSRKFKIIIMLVLINISCGGIFILVYRVITNFDMYISIISNEQSVKVTKQFWISILIFVLLLAFNIC